MTVFKSFFQILQQRKLPLMIYIPVFLGLCIGFSNLSASDESQFQPTNIKYGIVDEDNSALSQGLIAYLEENNTVTRYDEYNSSLGDQIYYDLLDYVLVIPEGFGDKLTAGESLDGMLQSYAMPDSTALQYGGSQISQFLSTYTAYCKLGISEDEILAKTVETLTQEGDIVIANEQGKVIVPDEDYYFFQYLPYLLICLMIQLLSTILVSYRKDDVARRMECAQMSVLKRNLCLFSATLVLSAVLFLLFLGIKFVIYGPVIHPYRLVNMILFFGVSVSLAYCLSVFSPSDSIISLVSNVVGLGLAFISGAFVPAEFLPEGILNLSKCFPMYWNLQINRWAVDGPLSPEPKVLFCFGFQLLYIVVFLAIALLASKKRQQR